MRLAPALRLAIATAAGLVLAGGARAQTALEAQVKAAFLTRFPAFASWPPGSFTGAEPLRLCVQGEGPVGPALDRSSGGAIGGRAIIVRRIAVVDGADGCHILYSGGSSRQSVGQALLAVSRSPVLTVTDAGRGPSRGMIHFVVFEDRVRFHIDAAQADRSGIVLSSKLLALGLSVKR
jgi:hypothetical protein